MVQESSVMERPIPNSLGALSQLLEQDAHLLSIGDPRIAEAALAATKDIFDLGLLLEPSSHQHLHPFIQSILEPPALSLRSKSKKKAADPAPDAAESILPFTPLGELTVTGMDPEQIWAQLELRTEGVSKVVKEIGAGENMDPDEGEGEGLDSDDEDDEDDEDDSDEDDDEEGDSEDEMTEEEFRRLMAEQGIDISDSEGSGGDSEDDELSDGDENEEDEENEDDDEEVSLGSEDDDELDGEEEEDEDEDEEDMEDESDDAAEVAGTLGIDMDGDDAEALFGQAGPSRKRRHPTLDDDFFSIDEFNRLTEQAEAGTLSGGRLGGDDDDEEEELGDVGDLMLREPGEDDEIMYRDFFEAPRKSNPTAVSKVKGKGKKAEPKKKGKGKGVKFDDMEDEDDDIGGDEADEEEYERMGRVKGDLFDDEDEEEEQEEKVLSNHEKRQLALAKQIAELEEQAIGPKDWVLMGEATSKARPENSLLEENLDFEHAGKVVPVITEETVKTLEEMIKQRILDNNFNSTVRVRAYEPTAFLPSRYFELQDTQSSKSLAQIYEEEYQAAASGGAVKDPRDEKLKKEHEEIDKLWNDICYKLDALSSLNFVPKQPKASITTISNLPTTSIESALPPTAAASSMLAPEEMFTPPQAASLVARSELTSEEAQKARQKARKAKAADLKKLEDMAALHGKSKKRKSAKDEKEDALKSLVKGGKGVTVVGKGAKEMGKAAKRSAPEAGDREDSKRLKL